MTDNQTSSTQQIAETVKFSDNGFSFVKTLGSFINNREFSQGFIKFLQNRNTADAYVWKCLSAIGDDLGDTVYENVANYIDFVSNVDTCKIQSLRSMLKLFGFDYTIFDSLGAIPVEILDLMNVLSINKKYLLNGTLISDTLKSDLSASGVIYDSGKTDLSRIFSGDALSSANEKPAVLSDDLYYSYVKRIYRDALSGFLTLTHNVSDMNGNKLDGLYIYKDNLSADVLADQYLESDLSAKRKLNVPMSFNQREIVNNIEDGLDSIDNYKYPYTQVIQEEIDRRARRCSAEDLKDIHGISVAFDNECSKYDYYRKAKVLEFANFVDNKYFIDHLDKITDPLSGMLYSYDKSYIRLNPNSGAMPYRHVLDGAEPDAEMIESVAAALAISTRYISKLRNRMKLQARKNFMKGTNTLLIYIINEYLIDYAQHAIALSANVSSDAYAQLYSNVLSGMAQHDLQNIDVWEYQDGTEYFNQEARTTVSALNSKLVNQDFWKQYDMTKDDGLSYRLNEIQRFYVDTMEMHDALSSNDQLADFLSTIYGVGADESFYDSDSGVFSMQLSDEDRFTNQIYPELSALSSAYIEFNRFLSAGDYSYPDGPVRDQISNALSDYIFKNLSADLFKDISSQYYEYEDNAAAISDDVRTLATEFDSVVNDNTFYFASSDNVYCMKEDDYGIKTYRHDFYIGNDSVYSGSNIYDRLFDFKTYISNKNNIVNHGLVDTMTEIYSQCNQICVTYKQDCVPSLETYGFQDINALTIDDELKYGYDYAMERKKERLQYLTEQLNAIREQANALKGQYENFENAFANAIANYKITGTTFKLGDSEIYQTSLGKCKADDIGAVACKPSTSGGGRWIIPEYPDVYFQESSDGNFACFRRSISKKYDANANIESRIEQVLDFMNTPTSFEVSRDADGTYRRGTSRYGLRDSGTYEAVVACKNNLESMKSDYARLKQTFTGFGGKFDDSAYTSIEKKIGGLLDAVVNFDDAFFENDLKVKGCIDVIGRILQLSSQYIPVKNAYNTFFKNSQQQQYLNEGTFDQSRILFGELCSMLQYASEKDSRSKLEFQEKYDEMSDRLEQIQFQFQELTSEIHGSGIDVSDYDGIIERDLDALERDLLDTIAKNAIIAQSEFDQIKTEVDSHMSTISAEISAYLGRTMKFDTAVMTRLRELNFFNKSQYREKANMFLTYGGLSTCYYPYYNTKNVTHPSYQVHPFLWNFVKKDSSTQNIVKSAFESITVEQLEEENIKQHADEYFGEYGNVIDKWRHPEMNDYTGYTTGYENSQHVVQETHAFSEVIDYDGCFYPPAVNMLVSDFEKSVNSLRNGKSLANLRSDMLSAIGPDVMSHVAVKDQFDEFGNFTGMSFVNDKDLFELTRSVIDEYVSNVDTECVQKYFAERTSENGVLTGCSSAGYADYVIRQYAETFYGRFYQHLGFGSNETERNFIADQICEYWPAILDITRQKRSLDEAYDMYKYGADYMKNSYVLFKQYGSQDMTYRERRDFTGQLWIRFNNHPLAFPAFNGIHTNVAMDESRIHTMISSLASVIDPEYKMQGIARNDMCQFYDFDIQIDGHYVYLVSKIPGIEENDFIQNYENPWIINCTPSMSRDGMVQIIMRASAEISQQNVTGIRSGFGYAEKTRLSSIPVISVDNYAYIGSYYSSSNETDFVYAKKRYFSDETVKLLDDIRILRIVNGNVDTAITGSGLYDENSLAADDICFANLQNGRLAFAVLTQQVSSDSSYRETNSAVNVVENSQGHAYGDPRFDEMNSHDVFDTDVQLITTRIYANRRLLPDQSVGSSYHNMNADMSYLPVYPGLSGESRIFESRMSSDMYGMIPVELLGRSNNIDARISRVNKNVDPYFDLSDMTSNAAFGRVYEDYDVNTDMTFRVFANPQINTNNVSADVVTYSGGVFRWNVSVTSILGRTYTPYQLSTMQVAFYNQDSLGKNPYYVGALSGITGDFITLSSYDADDELSCANEIPVLSSGNVRINMTGTYADDRQNEFDSNHIGNIRQMRFKFDGETQIFSTEFKLADISLSDFTYIRKGQLRVLLFNPNDMTIFNYWHYLDAYGAINALCGHIDGNMPEDYEISTGVDKSVGTGWIVSYGRLSSHYIIDAEISALKPYYEDKYGNKRFLQDIDVSKYSSLSDIYVLQGNRRLSFKYDEETMFDFDNRNYYFPSLNMKYPRNYGETYDKGDMKIYDGGKTSEVFKDENTFILDMIRYSDIDIGRIEMPIENDEPDCWIAYEKDTTFENGGNLSGIWGRFDIDDSRSAQYLTFFTDNCKASDIAAAEQKLNIYHDMSDFLNSISRLSAGHTEEMPSTKPERINFGIERGLEDAGRLLKVIANYKKAPDGIHLYFNYANYLNTPYVRLENRKLYPHIIESTYLHLAPGANGQLNVVAQMKCVKEKTIVGIKNITLAKYQIFNISDDKPKFIIQAIDIAHPGDATDSRKNAEMTISFSNATISRAEHSCVCKVFINETNPPKYPVIIDVDIPEFVNAQEVSTSKYDIKSTSVGQFTLTLKDDVQSVRVRLSAPAEKIKPGLKYMIGATCRNEVTAADTGDTMGVTIIDGTLTTA